MNRLCFLALPSLFFITLQAAPLELDILRQQYEKVYAERVTVPHETALQELNAKFLAALDAAADSAKRDGKLDDVLAIQADRKVIETKQPLPAEDLEATPEALKKLRGIYRDQSARIEADRAANQAALNTPFTVKLQELEVALTRADRIEEATLVRKHRESLALAMPTVPKAMPGSPESIREGSAASAPKGDDRKAAEWILGFAVPGSTTNVTVEGAKGRKQCFSLAELPEGDVAVTFFVISGFQKPLPRPISDEETAILAGLRHLREFQLNKISVTEEGLGFMATCPELNAVQLHNTGITNEVFRHLAAVNKLKQVTFNNTKSIDGSGFHLLAGKALEVINAEGSGFTDSALPHIAGFSGLRSLNLTGTQVTDEGLRALHDAKSLTYLNVSNTQVTPAGLLPLKELRLVDLSFGRASTWDSLAPTLPALASSFPQVEATELPRGGTYSAASIDPLVTAFPKLRILTIEEARFEPNSLPSLAKFDKLEQLSLRLCKITDADLLALEPLDDLDHLNLNDTSITDAGLAHLVELKSLKSLMISETQTTPAGLAKFQEERPDVKIQDRYYTPPR